MAKEKDDLTVEDKGKMRTKIREAEKYDQKIIII